MAMKIGGEYNPRYVALRHFLRMGDAAGLSERLVRAEIRKVSEAAFREAGFADVALFGEPTGRSALCGLHCIVGRKAP